MASEALTKQERRETILWWELRRVPYNMIVGAVGFLSIWTTYALNASHVEPGEDLIEPLVLLLVVALFGVFANYFYTFNWVNELSGDAKFQASTRSRRFGKSLITSSAMASIPL